VLITAFSAVFISVEFSILIGVALSIILFVPRAARLRSSELVVSDERVVRDRLRSDPVCTSMILCDIEGELFFGAAPELKRYFDSLKQRVQGASIRMLVLRVKRTRNPDMVCLECFEQFFHDMRKLGVTVLLCGVRADFMRGMKNLRFNEWLSPDLVYSEEDEQYSATLKAVRHAYKLLGDENQCDHCRQKELSERQKALYYLV
jgi:sulfate permease, SulP family